MGVVVVARAQKNFTKNPTILASAVFPMGYRRKKNDEKVLTNRSAWVIVVSNLTKRNMNSKVEQTVSDLDGSIARRSGTSAKTGHVKFLVCDGRDYQAIVRSVHRTYKGATATAKAEAVIWMWDSYLAPDGGYRVCG